MLYSATPDYLRNSVADAYKQVVPESVPLTESVLNLPFISLLVVCMLVPLCFALLAHPKDETKIMELDDEIYHHSLDTASHVVIARNTPAEKMNASRLVMYLVGGAIVSYSLYHFWWWACLV